MSWDRNSLSAWSPDENPLMIILMIIFSLVVVVYLMNLFIGLLNMAIETDNDRASYLAQKALILIEIELFYLLPHQRRWNSWYPDIIYYYADVEETRQTIKKLENEGLGKQMFGKGLKRVSTDVPDNALTMKEVDTTTDTTVTKPVTKKVMVGTSSSSVLRDSEIEYNQIVKKYAEQEQSRRDKKLEKRPEVKELT
ncbi:hypothetical protein GLOIN_2v1535699 [Rhizophagus clarus]|uniref:Ion transport domain-containing protein n=1 Tax=Rhizophagus clarus TaxID=94130 RepID=A0A8H3MFN7_9GLOM|nr:hypothetical protein GLOIN_2v1535699 [Rhizophagus clarus]